MFKPVALGFSAGKKREDQSWPGQSLLLSWASPEVASRKKNTSVHTDQASPDFAPKVEAANILTAVGKGKERLIDIAMTSPSILASPPATLGLFFLTFY